MTSGSQIYQFQDYRDYLRSEFAGTGEHRGRRAHLSQHLQCQTSFISQILTDRAHLSLEHAIQTSDFLKHGPNERKFFMLLVQKGKAGSRALESYFESEIQKIHREREKINERINVKTELTPEDQMRYYSSWFFSAIHILCALPDFNTVPAICERLKMDPVKVKEALQFLEERGFVAEENGRYRIGATRMHLPLGSPMLPRHHSNWRMKAMESVDQEKRDDLHYSALLGISKKDRKLFKEKLLQLIQEFEPTIEKSKEEIPVALLIDLFEL